MFSTLVVGTGTFFPSITEEDLTPNLQLPLILEAETLFVLGACNDLLLCSPEKDDQRELYICNPYTKQWVAVPPPPEVQCICPPIGFICEPYYNSSSKKDDLDDSVNDHHCKSQHKLSCTSTSTTSYTNTTIQLNAEYRCRVVRILQDGHVDLFFSETCYWRESVNVAFPRCYTEICSGGVAHNGKLYWHGSDEFSTTDDFTAFTFELDPFGTTTADGNINVDKCCITLGPVDSTDFQLTTTSCHMSLGSSQGCLQVCPREFTDNFSVWELEEVAGREDDLKWRLVVDEVSLYQIDSYSKHPLLLNYGGQKFIKIELGFHPNYKDIIYLDDYSQVLMCNLSARTLELVPGIPSFGIYLDQQGIHPFVLPWWPTPVPKLN
ncbi:uncharacterized protein LOC126584852 isoform X1 [Malus sylvestris]|uniref:uncharacterized protein LOC126584852 isoform X1 n=1 Tax=Malus sylvestris TaxID=3752 RepID=UPI0021AD02DC|nr:uncharacterized protein LOC126584852 isoform X1 [Malus sylvestris]